VRSTLAPALSLVLGCVAQDMTSLGTTPIASEGGGETGSPTASGSSGTGTGTPSATEPQVPPCLVEILEVVPSEPQWEATVPTAVVVDDGGGIRLAGYTAQAGTPRAGWIAPAGPGSLLEFPLVSALGEPLTVPTSLGLTADGSLYVAGAGWLRRVSSDGAVVWENAEPVEVETSGSALVVDDGGMAQVLDARCRGAECRGDLRRVGAQGEVEWNLTLPDPEGLGFAPEVTVTLAPDGETLANWQLGRDSAVLTKTRLDGTEAWRATLAGIDVRDLAIGGGGELWGLLDSREPDQELLSDTTQLLRWTEATARAGASPDGTYELDDAMTRVVTIPGGLVLEGWDTGAPGAGVVLRVDGEGRQVWRQPYDVPFAGSLRTRALAVYDAGRGIVVLGTAEQGTAVTGWVAVLSCAG